MNKNTSMSSIYNYFQDLLTSKVPVEKGPLEQINRSNIEIDITSKIHQIESIPQEDQKLNKGRDYNLIRHLNKYHICFISNYFRVHRNV